MDEYEHQTGLDAIRILSEANGRELAVMKTVLDRLDKSLFGNGQPGIVKEHETRLKSIEAKFWIIMGAMGLISFLTGNGVLSLRALIGK